MLIIKIILYKVNIKILKIYPKFYDVIKTKSIVILTEILMIKILLYSSCI
jgi:hypothetical protein